MLRPVEGTILTVVRSAAEAVERAVTEGETTLAGVLERAAAAARDAVASTPDLLPVLREAGVVDAGGRGFELLLAACLHVVADRPLPAAEEVHANVAVGAHAGDGHAGGDVADLRYEVMYFLEAPTTPASTGFKSAWGGLGDSIVVVGGDGVWNCHVHTDDIGAAIEAGIDVRPARATSASPTCSSRWPTAKRRRGCRDQTPGGTPIEHGHHRGGRGRGRRRAAHASCAASACSRSSPAGSR